MLYFCSLILVCSSDTFINYNVASIGVGFLCRRYPELMAEKAFQNLYSCILKRPDIPKLQCQVMENLHEYFEEQVGISVEVEGFGDGSEGKSMRTKEKENKVKTVDRGDTKSGLVQHMLCVTYS